MEAKVVLPEVAYGFIGLGNMGFPMALNLRARIPRKSKLIICDVVRAQTERFLGETENRDFICVAETPREIAEEASIIITMLPTSVEVKDVFTNPTTGLLSASRITASLHSILFIDCSTIDTAASLSIHNLVTTCSSSSSSSSSPPSQSSHRFVDAPVSGGPSGAQSASLTFMVGCHPPTLFTEIQPLLSTMGKRESIFHCGPPTSGLASKQINNYLGAICVIGTSEAFNMGRLYGLDPKTLANVINSSTGRNYNSKEQNPVKGVTDTATAARDFEGGFSIELCSGVVEMAVELGKQLGARSLLGETVMRGFNEASRDERCRGRDCRSFYRWLADV